MIRIVKFHFLHGVESWFWFSTNRHLVVVVHKGGAVIGDSLRLVKWVPLEVQQAVVM